MDYNDLDDLASGKWTAHVWDANVPLTRKQKGMLKLARKLQKARDEYLKQEVE